MAKDFNKVILLGRLARDPDIRYTPSKQKAARFSLATGRRWKNKATGEIVDQTDFVPVTAWGTLADILERYVRKGSQIMVEGRISVRSYDDIKTGQRRWITEVVAENIVLLGSPRREGDAQPAYQQGYSAQPTYQQRAPQPVSDAVPETDFENLSLRNEEGYEESFPLDFTSLGGGEDPSARDAEIPF
ncbi:MAG: single-stranded DNA-binding protein [Synergistes sp.]|nr:single-stranded DNA-binding protein [Synergistes sp.]